MFITRWLLKTGQLVDTLTILLKGNIYPLIPCWTGATLHQALQIKILLYATNEPANTEAYITGRSIVPCMQKT